MEFNYIKVQLNIILIINVLNFKLFNLIVIDSTIKVNSNIALL
jgi:hypothetical protein